MNLTQTEERIILESHKRSSGFGLEFGEKVRKDILSENALKLLCDENWLLLKHAVPVLERMFPRLSPYGYIAILSDSQGNIIHALGDPKFLQKSDKICLKPGANWTEQTRGTNAIGTALEIKAAIRIHGNEHYLQKNSFLTCSACPIYSPEGKLLGVLDISGHYKEEIPHSLSLACLAAESVETRLLLERSRQEKLEILKELDAVSSLTSRTIVSLNEEHRIVYLNQNGKQIFGDSVIGQDFREVIDSKKLGDKSKFQTVYKGRKRIWGFWNQQNLTNRSEETRYDFSSLYSNCPKVNQVIHWAKKAAEQTLPILLLGESGTGKEVFAQSIHNGSPRSNGPFIAVNCSSIPESLIESELFGYAKGAFTGANKEGGLGKFEAAHGGTIFLDEIGDMNFRVQSSLLRVLQEGRVIPLGSNRGKAVDVRVIAATHRNLWQDVQEGRFRQDLYFRLKGIVLKMIPLRERTDIIGLSKDILIRSGHSAHRLSTSAQKKLLSYSWPGNIRELQAALQQAMFLSKDGEITEELLLLEEPEKETISQKKEESSLDVGDWEQRAVELSMQKANGNISKAADLLGLGRNTLYRKLKKYDIKYR